MKRQKHGMGDRRDGVHSGARALTLVPALCLCVVAQTAAVATDGWRSVDEFNLVPEQISMGTCIVVTSGDTLIVGGRSWSGSLAEPLPEKAWIRRSADLGESWVTAVATEEYSIRCIGLGAGGDPFLITADGDVWGTAGFSLRISEDSGENWPVRRVIPIPIRKTTGLGTGRAAYDPHTNTLFLVGEGVLGWSKDMGQSWEQMPFSNPALEAHDIHVDASGILMAGKLEQEGPRCRWVVERLAGVGGQWENLATRCTDLAYATLVWRGQGGELLVAGFYNPGEVAMVISRSADGGQSWQDVDRVVGRSGSNLRGRHSSVALGLEIVVGYANGSGLSALWTVRASGDGGKTWSTMDELSGSAAYAVAEDSRGGLYVVGGSVGSRRAIVRKLPPPALPGIQFRRGDADGSGAFDVTDAIVTLTALFQGGPQPGCPDAADTDDDGALTLTDAVYSLNHLFRGESAPPAPGAEACGADPTEDSLPECARESSGC